jgi:hypothetical protein
MIHGPVTLISVAAPQNFTAAWADLGGEIRIYEKSDKRHNFSTIGLFLNLDINDSTDLRIRALAKHTEAGADEYVLPIRTVSASDVKVEDEYIEFNDDANQKVLIEIDTSGLIQVVQFQIMAGVLGAGVAAQVDSAFYNLGRQL